MKQNKIYFSMLIFVLVVIIVWTSYSMLNVGKKEEPHSVSVIVDNSNNERWIVMRQGLEQAAKDYGVDLNYVYTGEFIDMEEELSLIRREMKSGAEGIILQAAYTSQDSKEMLELGADTAVVLLESDLPAEGFYTYVGPDNQALGQAVADVLIDEYGQQLKTKKIGVLTGNQNQYGMQQRLAGFEARLKEVQVEAAWKIDREERKRKEEGEGEGSRFDVPFVPDIMIALGNDETEKLADYMQEHKKTAGNCLAYGVGCSEKAVYCLDKGILQKLVVPNEFNMGYQSMEAMAKQLKYHTKEAATIQVDYLVVDRENLYDTDNQKVLFPIVQ